MLNRYENKNDCFKEAAFLITKNSLKINVLSWKQIQMTRKQNACIYNIYSAFLKILNINLIL
jgi:hypothetical protein